MQQAYPALEAALCLLSGGSRKDRLPKTVSSLYVKQADHVFLLKICGLDEKVGVDLEYTTHSNRNALTLTLNPNPN